MPSSWSCNILDHIKESEGNEKRKSEKILFLVRYQKMLFVSENVQKCPKVSDSVHLFR
jgi:hypothetical protein